MNIKTLARKWADEYETGEQSTVEGAIAAAVREALKEAERSIRSMADVAASKVNLTAFDALMQAGDAIAALKGAARDASYP